MSTKKSSGRMSVAPTARTTPATRTAPPTPPAPPAPTLDKVARSEVILAYLSLALAVVAMAYLIISALVEHEACYGVTAAHIQCQSVDPNAAARIMVVLAYLAPLYAGAVLAMRWQTRAQDSFARNTALGLMATCVVLLLSIISGAMSGAGFFLLPSAVVLFVAGILGVWVWARGLRS